MSNPKGSRGAVRLSKTVRFQVLCEKIQDDLQQVAQENCALEHKMLEAQRGLVDCINRLKKRTNFNLADLKQVEERLSQVVKDLDQVGWAVLGSAWDMKRLQRDVVKLGQPSDTFKRLEKADPVGNTHAG